MLRGPAQCSQGPGSPLPPLVQVRGPWLSSPQDPTWLQELALGAKMLPLSQPETMSGQQNNLPHTGAQSSQSPNVWAHWLLCRQPGPEQPAFSAHTVPLPTLPQWGSLCSWGYWDWPPNPGLWLLKRQRQRDEVRSTRKKRNLKADSQGFCGHCSGRGDRKASQPSSATDWLWNPGRCLPLSVLQCPHA